MILGPLNIYSDDFEEGATPSFGIAGVQANVGDLILHTVQYNDSGGNDVAGPPTWNGQAMIPVGARGNGYMATQTWGVVAEATATADIICPVTTGTSFQGIALARTYSGVTSLAALVRQEVTDFVDPSLESGALASGDVIDEILNASGFGPGFSDATATTWAEADGQTRQATVATSIIQVGSLIFSTKTGTGALTCGYTPTGGAPAYVHSLIQLVAAGSGTPGTATPSGVSMSFAVGAATANGGSTTTISSIDQLVGGATSTIVFSEAFTPSSLTISDGDGGTVAVSSFSGSGTTWTFTCPALTDGVVGPKLGAVGVTATNGSDTTASFSSTYTKTGYTGVVLTSVATGHIGQGFSPALAAGNQLAYDATKGAIAADGVYTGTYTGTQTVWDHNATDFTWRSLTVNTIDGVPSGGVTASPAGVGMAFAVGTATAKGSAVATPAGVSMTFRVGRVRRPSTGTGTASPWVAHTITGRGI